MYKLSEIWESHKYSLHVLFMQISMTVMYDSKYSISRKSIIFIKFGLFIADSGLI